MKLPVACLAPILVLVCVAVPAAAQTAKRAPDNPDPARESAIKRCKENRGADCESAAGLKEWLREERPITDKERQAAAAARRHREQCAKTKGGFGC